MAATAVLSTVVSTAAAATSDAVGPSGDEGEVATEASRSTDFDTSTTAVATPDAVLTSGDEGEVATEASKSTDFDPTSSSQESEMEAKSAAKRCVPDSGFYLERFGEAGEELPVSGAWLYNSAVRPVPMPSVSVKLLALPAFWLISVLFHRLQRSLMMEWNVPGEPGQEVTLERSLPGAWQVAINAACVVLLSGYAVSAYIFHQRILDKVLNPLFTPRTHTRHVAISILMYAVGIGSSFFLTENWVPAAAGLFMFFGYAICGRTVQSCSSGRGQIGLGPSCSLEDVGMSFYKHGPSLESGREEGKCVKATLLGGEAGVTEAGGELHFANVEPDPFTVADDAVLVEISPGGACTYRGPCGRANIFRLDCLIVLLIAFGLHLPQFLIGSGGYNQCAGVMELVVSLIYIPVGYTCFAVFGFRVGLACRWSMMVVLVLCLWPFINMVLGAKGCATLTYLVSQAYLPQIWDVHATTIQFNRGFATCSESAHALGGETLLVASTTIAAWVHIISNFSFLVGFISGMSSMAFSKDEVQKVSIA